MSHTFCPECGNFVQIDSRGKFTCNHCNSSNEDNTSAEDINRELDEVSDIPEYEDFE